MPSPSKPRPRAKPDPSDPRGARALVRESRRALAASEPFDLDTLHQAFETLRDATEEPARLFALAVEEAELLDAAVQAGAKGDIGESLVVALLRVLEGPAEGTEPKAVRRACERMEAVLRGAIGRALDDGSRVRVLGALVNGYARIGELEAARDAASRQVRSAQKLARLDGGQAHVATLGQAFELAIEAGELQEALRWARARVAALQAQGESLEPEVLAEALEPLWWLWMEAGDPAHALDAALAWREAEERVLIQSSHGRRGRLLEACAAFSRATEAASERPDEWIAAASAWVEQARVPEPGARPEDRVFAAKRLADALRALHVARQRGGQPEAALEAAHEWLEVERVAGSAWEIAEPLAAIAGAQATLGNWAAAAQAADEALSARAPSHTPKDPVEQAWFEAGMLGLSARAHFATGTHAMAATRARAWLEAWLSGPRGAEAVPAMEVGPNVVLLAQAEQALLPDKPGAARTRALASMAAHAEALDTALHELPRSERDPAALAAVLAYRARAASLAGENTPARQWAERARTRLTRASMVPREVLAYVSFVDEATRTGRGRRVQGETDALIASARALAAAEAGDAARAGAHLASLDPATLMQSPDALAHTLAACARVLAAHAPGDPLLAEGESAWRELAPYATLLPALSP